jgi:hypothetical protein
VPNKRTWNFVPRFITDRIEQALCMDFVRNLIPKSAVGLPGQNTLSRQLVEEQQLGHDATMSILRKLPRGKPRDFPNQ